MEVRIGILILYNTIQFVETKKGKLSNIYF